MTDIELPEAVAHRLTDAGSVAPIRRAGAVALEARALGTPLEVRGDTDALPEIFGYASVFDFSYPVAGGPDAGGWIETIDRSAFKRTLQAKPDVVLLFDHGGMPLARSTSGTLTLEDDGNGLLTETPGGLDVRGNVYAAAMVSALTRGDVHEMSFAFRVPKGGSKWSADYTERHITEISLARGDVSVVTSPASPATVALIPGAPHPSLRSDPKISLDFVRAFRATVD